MGTAQPAGHLYGPPAPHIGFWYGNYFLGEVRGHPSDIGAARYKLHSQSAILQPGLNGDAVRVRLPYASAVLYCGERAVHLGWGYGGNRQ